MSEQDPSRLTAEQRAMVALWEAHTKAEFVDKNAVDSCASQLPIVGVEGARKVQDPLCVPPNLLLKRFEDDPPL